MLYKRMHNFHGTSVFEGIWKHAAVPSARNVHSRHGCGNRSIPAGLNWNILQSLCAGTAARSVSLERSWWSKCFVLAHEFQSPFAATFMSWIQCVCTRHSCLTWRKTTFVCSSGIPVVHSCSFGEGLAGFNSSYETIALDADSGNSRGLMWSPWWVCFVRLSSHKNEDWRCSTLPFVVELCW